jgi:hypothetical protein
MTELEYTSVPPWIAGTVTDELDRAGSSYLLVGVGDTAALVLEGWRHDLPDRCVAAVAGPDEQWVRAAMVDGLRRARVGVRVRLAGPAGPCLRLRAAALQAGLEDDEIGVFPTGRGDIDVFCTHCRGVTSASANIGDVVPCGRCRRNLVVYHHVSRRSGRFMGYMVDAEVVPA